MEFMKAEVVLHVKIDKLTAQLKKAEDKIIKSVNKTHSAMMRITQKAQSTIVRAEAAAYGQRDRLRKAFDAAHGRAIEISKNMQLKAAKDIERATKAAYKRIAAAGEKAFNRIKRAARLAFTGIATVLGLSIRAAMKQEDALFLLNAALKISGEYTKELEMNFVSFAAEMQRTTVYGDEFVLSLMQQQRSLGVTADRLKDGAKMAIGLATATGQGIESMSRYVALAFQGEFTMLRRYIPALRATTDATEQLAIVTKFAADGFALAEARAETTSGKMKQLWNTIGDVGEIIGGEFLNSILKSSNTLKTWAQDGAERIKEWAKNFAEKVIIVLKVVFAVGKALAEHKDLILLVIAVYVGFAVLTKVATAFLAIKAALLLVNPLMVASIGSVGAAGFLGLGAAIAFTTFKLAQLLSKLLEYQRVQRSVNETVAKQAEILRKAADRRAESKFKKDTTIDWKRPALIDTENMRDPSQIAVAKPVEVPFVWVPAGAGDAVAQEAADSLYDLAQHTANRLNDLDLERNKAAAEAMVEQTEEHKNQIAQRITHWEALGKTIEHWMKRSANWGRNLGDVLTNAFDRAADSFANMLMGQKASWKSFSQMFIKELLAMIVQLQIAFVWKTALGGWSSMFPSMGRTGSGGTGAVTPGISEALDTGFASGGHVLETGIAKVHKGEDIIPAGGGGWTLNVSGSGVAKDVDVAVEENPDERTYNVILTAMAGDGPMRRAVSSIRR